MVLIYNRNHLHCLLCLERQDVVDNVERDPE